MLPAYLKKFYKQVPESVKLFAKRALLLFVTWKVLYHFLLQPKQLPDKWLTHLTGVATAKMLSFLYKPGFSAGDVPALSPFKTQVTDTYIYFHNDYALVIAHACNALEIFVLYLAFLWCLPTSLKRGLLFAVCGVLGIFMLNIIRCYALAILNLNNSPWMNFNHHYTFTAIVYACVFFTWVNYAKKFKPFVALNQTA